MTRPRTTPPARTSWQIEPVGDTCLLVRVGDRVDAAVSNDVHAVVALLRDARLPGVTDIVPAFTTVALHYQPRAYTRTGEPAVRQLKRAVETALAPGLTHAITSPRQIDIPVCYGGEFGPDLADVAAHCKLSAADVIERHSGTDQVLYTFFFAPGNPFCGPVDPSLAMTRRKTPRTHVPAGSVAIANGISTIYQTASPGGWHIIGRTPLNLFDLHRDPPMQLQLGDRIRFVPISRSDFDLQLEPRA